MAPTKRAAPVAAVESEPEGMRIDGDVAEWKVPEAEGRSYSARLAVTPAGVTVAGRLDESVSTVFVGLELGKRGFSPLVRTREGYRADVGCEAALSGAALGRCEKSVRAQKEKLAELEALLSVEYEVGHQGVRAGDKALSSSSAALTERGGATEFELRVGADDLPWIGELPVRELELSISKSKRTPSVTSVRLPKGAAPGLRAGVVAEAFWPAVGPTTEARAHVLGLYRASETSPTLRFLDLAGPPFAKAAPVPPMSDPVIVDLPIPPGRTLMASGDVEIQERVARGLRVVTSHKAGNAVGQILRWDERTSKVRKTAVRPQGIDVLVETVFHGEKGLPPDNIALQVFRCRSDGSVQTLVDFGNPFLHAERFEDANLGTFGIRGKGWRPREFADLDLRWIFDPETATYIESHKGF